MSKKENSKGLNIVIWFLIAAIAVISVYIATIVYKYSGIKYIAIFAVFSLIFIALIIFLKNRKPYISIIISILLVIILALVGTLGFRVNNSLSAVKPEKEYTSVQIVALKESDYTAESDFSRCNLGYANREEGLFKKITDILDENKKIVFKSVPYESISQVYEMCYNNKVQLIALTNADKAQLEELYPGFMDNFKVIFEKRYLLEAVHGKQVDISKEPFTIYLQGADRTADGDINSTGSGDVNILFSVNPVKKLVNMQVIPRDTLIKIDGAGGRSKLTYAGTLGGIQSSINSIEKEFGIDINYYAKINFQGLEGLVDALGGVNVYSYYTFQSGRFYYQEGYNYVDGDAALEFARVRKILPGNELARGIHQQELIKGILNKFYENPGYDSLMSILNTLSGNFVSNFPEKDYAKAIQVLIRIMPELQKMEAKSVKGEFIWQTDEVDKVNYLYYFVPAKGEKERIQKEINAVVEK